MSTTPGGPDYLDTTGPDRSAPSDDNRKRLVVLGGLVAGAAVVAAGVSVIDGKVVSDVDDEVAEVAGWLSPRIGGVGAMTRAFLLMNTLEAAERAADRDAAAAGDAGTLDP